MKTLIEEDRTTAEQNTTDIIAIKLFAMVKLKYSRNLPKIGSSNRILGFIIAARKG